MTELTEVHGGADGLGVQRERLHVAMIALEDAAAMAAIGREEAWKAHLLGALPQAFSALDSHISFTEGPGGLYEDILGIAPRLAHAVSILRTEHPMIAAALADLQNALLLGGQQPDDAVEHCRRLCGAVLALLVRHRQRGADLTHSAYDQDLGGDG